MLEGKKYHNHRTIYESFHGLIKYGFVIDHINIIKTDNSLLNLQAISQSQNIKKGKTDKYSKQPRSGKSFDLETNEQKVFKSMYVAGKYFNICISSVRRVAENITRSAVSKNTGHRIQFSYI